MTRPLKLTLFVAVAAIMAAMVFDASRPHKPIIDPDNPAMSTRSP